MNCPHCHSKKTKKNGHTHYGKQNFQCNDCHRQFVEGGQDWFVSDHEKGIIGKLLLERISLAGVCRVMGVSQGWLMGYLKKLYADSPDDLNAILALPDNASYLSDRFDEEIERLKKNEKDTRFYTEIDNSELETSTETVDGEHIMDIYTESTDLYDSLEAGMVGDLLMDKLYSKEQGRRVEFFGIQLDEMWTFVGSKENKKWLWLALNPANRQIIAFHVGSRSAKDAQFFYEKIPTLFKGEVGFFSDYWQAYVSVFENEDHFGVGKDSGLTAYIERFNCTIRQRASRLVRKALSFSKSLEHHIGAIKYFICHYNLEIKALHV